MLNSLAQKLSKLIIEYCLEVKPGQLVLIEGSTEAEPLVRELYRVILRAGGQPEPIFRFADQEYLRLTESQPEQLAKGSELDSWLIENMDAMIRINSDINPNETNRVSADRLRLRQQGQGRVYSTFMKRLDTPGFGFVNLPWPTHGIAQKAQMSREELAGLLEEYCFLNQPDPVSHWKALEQVNKKAIDRLSQAEEIHIRAPGTDLRLSVKGRRWISAHGNGDLPDGEVFTAPIEDSAEGHVTFSFPSRREEGIRLEFSNGKVVGFGADVGEKYLAETLKMPGADRLGEIGIGTNFAIESPTGHILFDEKMGGTIHLAIGAAYPATGGVNQSDIHRDLIVDLRNEGELRLDGQVFIQKGEFQQ